MTSVAFEKPLPQLEATLDAPPDLIRLGARIERPLTRAILSRWEPATYTGAGWRVSLDAPPEGPAVLVWRTGDPEPPSFEFFVELPESAVASGLHPAYVHQVVG